MKEIMTPLTDEIINDLEAGDEVLISGQIYTMRDLAHKKITDLLKKSGTLPFDLKNQIIYYCGPTPAKDGKAIGACGPTTSSRMDKYTPVLLKYGVKGLIGKGERSEEVKEALKKYNAVYFSALGGLGADYADYVISSEIVAFPELGPEAVYKLTVEDFYAVVINDVKGNDFYLMNRYH